MILGCGIGVAVRHRFASVISGQFEWNPSGVIFGIDFQTDRIFDGETVTNDYSTVLDNLDPASVSSRGMYINGSGPNTHFPEATGALLGLLASLNYTIIIFWERDEADTALVSLISFINNGDSPFFDVDYDNSSTHASGGSYHNLGISRGWSDNVIAASLNGDGVLASLNGAPAVLSTPQITTAVARATIGHRDGSNDIDGWIKAIIFYEATSVAATIEAYSANAAPTNTIAPAMSGFQEADGELTISTGTWDGTPTGYSYQWYSDNSVIGGATSNSLDLTGGMEATVITCLVQAFSDEGRTGIVVGNPMPVPTEPPPVITGTALVGQTLSCSTGAWGNGPTSYTYRWINDSGYIAGATASTYLIQAGDLGNYISCEVTASNDHGSFAAYSNTVGPVS